MANHGQAVVEGPICPGCGARVLDGAATCTSCGHDLRPVSLATCSITWWRGYRSSTFVAVDEHRAAVAESPAFRWRKAQPPPDDEPARTAFERLAETLRAAGWRPLDEPPGRDWFASCFRRYVERPAGPEPEPEPLPQPAPEAALAAPPPVRKVPRAVQAQRAPAGESPAAAPARRSPGRAMIAALALIALGVGAVAGYAAHRPRPRTLWSTVTVDRAVMVPAATADAPARRVPAGRRASALVLDVTNVVGRPSWLEIRRGSPSGFVLYSAQLPPGAHLRFRGPRLWARFGAAANLAVSVDGRRLPLTGTVDRTFTAAR